MYIVSRCLLGVNCKYNGANNHCEDVVEFTQKYACVDVCPECAGGLKIPREPSEIVIRDGQRRVESRSGEDVTDCFLRGAQRSWEHIQEAIKETGDPVQGAILKAKSPSCGVGMVYDGQFNGTLVEGNGFLTELLLEKGIPVWTEKNFLEKIGE